MLCDESWCEWSPQKGGRILFPVFRIAREFARIFHSAGVISQERSNPPSCVGCIRRKIHFNLISEKEIGCTKRKNHSNKVHTITIYSKLMCDVASFLFSRYRFDESLVALNAILLCLNELDVRISTLIIALSGGAINELILLYRVLDVNRHRLHRRHFNHRYVCGR